MKITKIETILAHKYLFVHVYTDEGIVGLGECGNWGYLKACATAIDHMETYLIGQDPLKIEHHNQYLYRWSHFRGAVIMGAISAIDIALWDIAGKYYGAPCYQLMGGKYRDKVRVYHHVRGATKSALMEGCKRVKDEGYTAIGHLTPFLDESPELPYSQTFSEKMVDAIETVKQYRQIVGDKVDLCLELHRRLTPAEAVVLAHGLEEFKPFFYEDPILPDNLDAMALVASKINIPIATGERLHNIHEFEMLLQRGAVQYVRPDVCMAGGLTHCKKIAAVAEAHYVDVVPHNPLSPVSTAACVQLAACIPNFALQEYPGGEWESPKRNLVNKPIDVEDGYLLVPNEPGIGIELSENVEQFPFVPEKVEARLDMDGSIVDQ
jgi:galactonate dehydratase